ncbi:MAG: hypothetical protein WA951_04905 [Leeuwenhoekiella sp.]
MFHDTAIEELLMEAQAHGHLHALLTQLDKDFLQCGLSEDFDFKNSPKTIGRNLTASIYSLIITDFERYLSLLYRIDIDERKIEAMPVQRVDELAQSVTMLILKRELKKVKLKSKF